MDVTKDILNQLAKASDLDDKRTLIAKLGNLGDESSLKTLVGILNDEDDIQMKSYAADAIVEIGGRKACSLVIKLFKSNSWITRMKSAEILGELKERRAVFYLVRILRNESVSRVKEWAAISLGKMKDKRAVRALIQSMKCDENWEVRMESAMALGKIRDSNAKKALITTFYEDDEYRVSWAAASALAKLNDSSSKILLKELTNELVNIIKKEKDEAKLSAAAKTLGEIGNESAAKVLLRTMKVSKELVKLEINVALEKMAKRMKYSTREDFIENIKVHGEKMQI